jgi:pyruvate/2-oxoglutarate dehydrogenase complex dihydrolipoamide dehydrogenase (E3) component/uncharacterized membrane protein YdjX (TVP38/TMEM64 family)
MPTTHCGEHGEKKKARVWLNADTIRYLCPIGNQSAVKITCHSKRKDLHLLCMHIHFDVAVIGAGSGGLTAAVGLARSGKRVLLIEREHMGGECTNSGCIPSKALLHHAKTYNAATTIAGHSPASETYRQNALTYVREKIAAILDEETPEHFRTLGITVVMGEAEFTGTHTITVGATTYHFKKAVIATGSVPRVVPVPGLEAETLLTNQNLFTLKTIPSSLLIIGAGPIGMEMGQAFALLGSRVTIVDNGPEFAKFEDEALRPIIKKVFTDHGVTILQNASVERVANNEVVVRTQDTPGRDDQTIMVPAEKILLAIGRTPRLPQGLRTAGIEANEFGITVDKTWRTSNKHVYALGDVAAKLKFTHVADDTARQVVAHIVSRGILRPQEKLVPKVTYTDPEIAQVGLSWLEAKTQYGAETLHRIEVPFSTSDRAKTDNATVGLLIVIAKRLSGKILGVHIVGPRAGELIGTFTLAMENKLSLYRLRSTIFAYPTYSLILKKASDYFLAAQITSLKTDLWRVVKSVLPKVLVLLLWCLALLALREYQIAQELTATEIALTVLTYATGTAVGPLMYIAAYAVRPLTFLPGTLLTILSGVFFGLWGILYTIIGANLSATLAYAVGRFFSGSQNQNSASLLATARRALGAHPFMTILTMRLTFFPYDVVNYGAGFLRVPFAPYLMATIVGTLLGIATFVSLGASLNVETVIKDGITAGAIDTTFILLSVGIFIASLTIARVVKRK